MTPLISAHRGGVGSEPALENTVEGFVRAAKLDCEFVEFDVQRCADGALVLHHDDFVPVEGRRTRIDAIDLETFVAATGDFLTYEQGLELLAGKKRAHVDLKFTSPPEAYDTPARTHEVAAVKTAIEIMGADQLIVTTLEDKSVAAIRAWSAREHPTLLVGLSLGRDIAHLGLLRRTRVRISELLPGRRMSACDANLLVANRKLARISLARWAKAHDVPLLVWTVDESDELAHWLADRRTWMVTTNVPELAISIRAGRR